MTDKQETGGLSPQNAEPMRRVSLVVHKHAAGPRQVLLPKPSAQIQRFAAEAEVERAGPRQLGPHLG